MKKLGTAIILVLLVAILAGGVVFFIRQTSAPTYPIEIMLPPPSPEIEVYVSGEVQNPGIYVLNEGARVSEAVEAAGGFTSNADGDAINLARRLRDGAHIHVRKIGEAPQRININTADAWLLRALPGIGEVLSERIIEYRTEHGPFESIDELKKVRGIRESTFERLRDKITVH
ncbi:ComEA family DNA-binding protein [Dehalococcoidia bacterium]|nr:ComEA family DNA-binding protein [Dehalococcoidia bacterium]